MIAKVPTDLHLVVLPFATVGEAQVRELIHLARQNRHKEMEVARLFLTVVFLGVAFHVDSDLRITL